MDLKQKLEDLTKQYREVSDQAAQSNTLKVKLEGAIEMTQALLAEEEQAKQPEDKKKK
tara:strand:+ start:1333 stop:1506 length:174 start_codon:yes stop_codon:yes gene_type:complete